MTAARRIKDEWEEQAKDRFIAALKEWGRRDWIVEDTDVVVHSKTNRNFDYELQAVESKELIALEIFRLVESKEEIVRQRSWATIANSIAAELRRRNVIGFTIRTPYVFDVPDSEIARYQY